jgi:hypothetical protein
MKYCTTVQCIVPYGEDYHESAEEWHPELDDEDFERTSKYHLSGLGFRSATIEEINYVYPKRHGCDEINPVDINGFELGHASFHPYCLETYRRVSSLRLGRVDLLDLAEWIERQDSSAPYHPAVRRGASQWWEYTSGDEFLVSDPLRIPALSSMFKAAHRPQQDFDARSSPFGEGEADSTRTPDIFGKLPEELRDMVLVQLSSKDIANLRLASRTFRRLPYTTWHDLLKKEMPWVWEAWTDRPYLLMSCATKAELIAHDRTIEDRRQTAAGLPSKQRALEEELIAQDDADFRKPRPVQQLDRLHTDWYFLYSQLRQEWAKIKGLQNRERIWKAAEFVVRRIARQDEPLDIAKEEHAKAYPYHDPNVLYQDHPHVRQCDELYDPSQHFLTLQRVKQRYSHGEGSGEGSGEDSGEDSGGDSGEEDRGEGTAESTGDE